MWTAAWLNCFRHLFMPGRTCFCCRATSHVGFGNLSGLVSVCGLAGSGVRMRAGGCKQLRLAQGCRAKCVRAASVAPQQSVTRPGWELSHLGQFLLICCSAPRMKCGKMVGPAPPLPASISFKWLCEHGVFELQVKWFWAVEDTGVGHSAGSIVSSLQGACYRRCYPSGALGSSLSSEELWWFPVCSCLLSDVGETKSSANLPRLL